MRWLGVCTIVMLAGCPKRAELSTAELSLRDAVLTADTRWSQRDQGGLPRVLDALESVPAEVQQDPRVVWRQVRVMVSIGLTTSDPLEARRIWTNAREMGVACFEGRRGGMDLAGDRAACAAWASHAWVRWMVAFGGEAAAIDAEEVQELVGAAGRGGHQNIAGWAELLLDAHVLGVSEHAVLGRFTNLVDHAVAANRDDAWVRWADFARVSPSHAQAHRPGGRPETPEAKRVVEMLNERDE